MTSVIGTSTPIQDTIPGNPGNLLFSISWFGKQSIQWWPRMFLSDSNRTHGELRSTDVIHSSPLPLARLGAHLTDIIKDIFAIPLTVKTKWPFNTKILELKWNTFFWFEICVRIPKHFFYSTVFIERQMSNAIFGFWRWWWKEIQCDLIKN